MRKLKNEELGRLSVEEFKAAKKLNACLVLDNIRSMNNIGSAFRTGDAFRIEKIYLTGISATPPHRDIHKTALGATDSVDWEHVKDTLELIKRLREEGYQIVALEQAENSMTLEAFEPDPDKKYAIVFGNEVFGVDQEVVSQSDICVEIPQFGTKHSLNISVSIGVILWDFFSKIKPSFTDS
ncbi:MAG: RNA methyltransferase [Cytophagales bacterium]|nr:RNA methyltransferase [Cytophagales bacterium]